MIEVAAQPSSGRVHYGWIVAATGLLCTVACLGLGRFTLGMVLPSMASSLGLTYARLGTLGTANFLGYLTAVLLCGRVARRTGSRRLIFAALLLVAGSMAAMSRAGGFATLVVLYALTGIGSGATNVPVMGVVARWFDGRVRGRAAGIVSSGSGIAIIASGRLVPAVNRVHGAEGWRVTWLLLSGVVLAIALLAATLLRNDPAEKGMRPVGAPPPMPGPVSTAPQPARATRRPHQTPAVYLLGVIYACFGYTYAIYVTFVVTLLVRERGFSESTAGLFWSTVGLLSLFSGPLFGAISDRVGRRAGLVAVFSLLLLAYALVGAPLPRPALYLSVACFGIAAWGVPSIMIAAVTDHVGPHEALGAFGLITFFFGLGQVAGPAVAGLLAERTHGFASSFLMAAGVAAVAIAMSRLVRATERA